MGLLETHPRPVWKELIEISVRKMSLENTLVKLFPRIEGILPKGPYPPCLRMADKALLAGYPLYLSGQWVKCSRGVKTAIFQHFFVTENVVVTISRSDLYQFSEYTCLCDADNTMADTLQTILSNALIKRFLVFDQHFANDTVKCVHLWKILFIFHEISLRFSHRVSSGW